MTDIMDMPAGREMNELIATKVMGWRISRDMRRDLGLNGGQYWEDWIAWARNSANYPFVKDTGNRLIVFRAPRQNGRTWDPSNNITDAWEVVEHMDTYFRLARDSREVVCCFAVREDKATVDYYGAAATVPLAICRAAYQVMTKRDSRP